MQDGCSATHLCAANLPLAIVRQRAVIHESLANLPPAIIARDDEVLRFIDANALFGQGIGYVDAHLLAAVRLTSGAFIWSRDKRLKAAAVRLALAAEND